MSGPSDPHAGTFPRVWELVERHRDAVDAALWERIRAIPAMAAAFGGLDQNPAPDAAGGPTGDPDAGPGTQHPGVSRRPASGSRSAAAATGADRDDPALRAERDRSRELTRGALVEGRWEPYLANLREQGRRYARQGLPLRDWFSLLDPYRTVLLPAALATGPGAAELVLAVDAYVDLAMREIGAAYVAESEELARSAEGQRDLYAKLFRSCPLGLTLHRIEPDGTRTVVGVNASIERIRDTAYAEAPDREAIRSAFDRDVRTALATGRPVESTVTVGSHVLRQWVVPLDERHAGGIHEDATGKERTERALRRTVAELERTNRDLDQFAYVASHDLKAPLRDIENLARWLEEDLGDTLPAASARHVTRLRERVARMERLLEDLLQYSRAGRTSALSQAVDLDQALGSALALVAVPPSFTVEATGGPLVVRTPRAPLELVLRNLVANAVKHHDRPTGQIRVGWRPADPMVEITVSDDGPGIAPEYHARVFEMFQTLRPRDVVEGSGMGLAVVRRVVEAYGGTASLDSDGERGATFRFTWPLVWAPEEEG